MTRGGSVYGVKMPALRAVALCLTLAACRHAPPAPICPETQTIVGLAQQTELGAILVADDANFLITGMNHWPEQWVGRRVTVAGWVGPFVIDDPYDGDGKLVIEASRVRYAVGNVLLVAPADSP